MIDLKDLFSRCQNLNLIVLIEDLRRGLVARGSWVSVIINGNRTMCPLRHTVASASCASAVHVAERLDVPVATLHEFTTWWDCVDALSIPGIKTRKTKELRTALEEILAERLADADAVQAVITSPSCEEEVAGGETGSGAGKQMVRRCHRN